MACRHSDRHVYVALGCVFDYATIACALRWGVLLGFAHPVVGPPFQVQVRCRRWPAFETAHMKKAGLWL